MNQRQTLPKPRNTRHTHENNPSASASRPPVLFSLPDLSEPCEAKPAVLANPIPASSVSTYSDRIAASVPLTKGLPRVELPQAVTAYKSSQNSSSFLNAAIGFLLFAMLLIGVKLYTDRVSERSKGPERLISNSQANPVSVLPAATTTSAPLRAPVAIAAENPSPDRMELPKEIPASLSVGPQQATYEAPLGPAAPAMSNQPSDSSGSKAVLEISDPVVSASYPADPDEVNSAPSPAVYSAPVPQAPLSLPRPAPVPTLPAPSPTLPGTVPTLPGTVPQAFPQTNTTPNTVPNTIPASSLNTRDMILLRQGKTIDLRNRDRETKSVSLPVKTSGSSDVKLTGEAYPPIRQKYEPIGLESTTPTTTRPTSIEVPEPPKPYQPIGASLD